MAEGTRALLAINKLTRHYGGVVACSEITFALQRAQIFSLIGPNGAGKTTLFNCVTGMDKPTAGTVSFRGKPITGLRPDQITTLGIARTFQNIRLFSDLTLLDNVKIGRHSRTKSTLIGSIFRTRGQRREEAAITERASEMLAFVGLDDVMEQVAGNLSYGAQRRLEIARALATTPRLLLLDEPAAGMNPYETQELIELIYAIREQNITVLLIEHDMKLVMQISDWVTVLEHGEKISEGEPADVQNDERVIAAYLGTTES